MLPSASLAKGNFGMYEPVHGSAPDIAGQGKANPMATILSSAMMMRYTFDLQEEADAVEAAVRDVLKKGYRTPDIMTSSLKCLNSQRFTFIDTAEDSNTLPNNLRNHSGQDMNLNIYNCFADIKKAIYSEWSFYYDA